MPLKISFDEYRMKAQLEEHGWTDGLIAKLLGKPDKLKHTYGHAHPTHLYATDRVLAAERTETFTLAQAKFVSLRARALERKEGRLERERQLREDEQRLAKVKFAERMEKLRCQWQKLVSSAPSTDIALIDLVQYLNRCAKSPEYRLLRRNIYKVKDAWITAHQHFLTDAHVTRTEDHFSYAGYDEDDDHPLFEKKIKILYVCNFNVGSRTYCFHTYIQPRALSEGVSEDLSAFGRTPSAEEKARYQDVDVSDLIEIVLRCGTFVL